MLSALALAAPQAQPPAEAVSAAAPAAVPAPARVVVVEQPHALVEYSTRLTVLRPMVDRGLTNLTRKPTPSAAWRSLVSTQDVVGIKVFCAPGAMSGTRPAVVEAVVQGLLEAGIPAGHIIVWDKHAAQLRLAGYFSLADRYGIRVEGALEAGYSTNQFYETPIIGQLVWGDREFGQTGEGLGRKSFVSRLVADQMTKIINITPLLNHNLVGVSGCLYSLAMGSVDNTMRFSTQTDRLVTAVPEIYALPILGDRVVLNIVDALAAQYYGEERSLLHYSAVLNQLRFSTDPVALDVLSIEELQRQREIAGAPPAKASLQLYQNAALVEIGVSDSENIRVEWLKPTE